MTTENLRTLIRLRLQQADESIVVGRLALGQAYYRDAVNRFYYAMFYGVLALLSTRKLETSKHQAALALFSREFVQPGHFPKEYSSWLHAALRERLQLDYEAGAQTTKQEAESHLSKAEAFLDGVKRYLESYLEER